MALKDLKPGDALPDGSKVGDSEFTQGDDGTVTKWTIAIVGKTFNKEGVDAKIAELDGAKATYEAIKAEFPKAVAVAEPLPK